MSRKSVIFFRLIFCLFCLFFSCVSAPIKFLTGSEYEKLKSEAGNSWDIDIQKDTIILTSRKDFYFYAAVSLPYMDEDELKTYIKESGRKSPLVISLIFVPKWPEEQTAKARKTNDEIDLKLYELPEKYGLTHLMRNKQNSFFPETPEDEVKIKKYEKEYADLVSQMIRIPDWNSASYSIIERRNEMGFEMAYSDEMPRIDLRKIFAPMQ